jgi:UDP-glucose 4-epimerase
MTCRLLVAAGHNIINVDRRKSDIPGVHQYPFDIDNNQLKGIINLTKPDTIMHFAADHEVGRSVTEPGVFYWNNVANTVSLLNHAVKSGVKNFVFSSSSSVYGDIKEFPTTEDTPRNPISPYGKSKNMVEEILPDFYNAYGLKYASLRYFNAAGADPSGECGYTQEPASHLIPIICRSVINDEPLMIYGNDYNTEDGTCVRDYTHVFDIASAHLAAMNYLDDNGVSGAFNIGAGRGNSILSVIKEFEKVTGKQVKYEYADRRPGDPPTTYADITKTKNAFGWTPIYNISDIVKHAYDWEVKQQRRKK